MNKIKQIKLKHFKFFYGEVTIDLERQNALIVGENGSGKSSLFLKRGCVGTPFLVQFKSSIIFHVNCVSAIYWA
ncbi:MAG: hypothetical protein EKK39_04405 [Sphingobacteriales bacterium]|uniref:AAA family ATPase n=1 Tax=Hydrotalea flava TaxID=714549 RepID=UPI0008320888|nr:MAG: hypothetical protein EKK39_04405 [Sphingobacteriales bacterium]